MFDDPDLILGGTILLAQTGALGYLVFREWQASLRRRSVDIATILGTLAIGGWFWFVAWIVSGGLVPHGLWGLGAGLAIVIVIFAFNRRTR